MNNIKPPFLKGIYSQEVKDENINNDKSKKNIENKKIQKKTLEDMEGSKNDYSKLVYKSGVNQYFDFIDLDRYLVFI